MLPVSSDCELPMSSLKFTKELRVVCRWPLRKPAKRKEKTNPTPQKYEALSIFSPFNKDANKLVNVFCFDRICMCSVLPCAGLDRNLI
ncbi:uncharacterized protein PRCAT00004436001 [Priceomyces carsonii]|uniref:uncharacterized protein n=1 Tax=Priceomyces carsonii TaxID=28549 RepID=UPI002ED77BC9|nr:unnamed protein product [Priceomyces carsonii]